MKIVTVCGSTLKFLQTASVMSLITPSFFDCCSSLVRFDNNYRHLLPPFSEPSFILFPQLSPFLASLAATSLAPVIGLTPLLNIFRGCQWLILGDLESLSVLAGLQIVSRGDMPFQGLHARLAANHAGNLIRLECLFDGHGRSRRGSGLLFRLLLYRFHKCLRFFLACFSVPCPMFQ